MFLKSIFLLSIVWKLLVFCCAITSSRSEQLSTKVNRPTTFVSLASTLMSDWRKKRKQFNRNVTMKKLLELKMYKSLIGIWNTANCNAFYQLFLKFLCFSLYSFSWNTVILYSKTFSVDYPKYEIKFCQGKNWVRTCSFVATARTCLSRVELTSRSRFNFLTIPFTVGIWPNESFR